MRTQSRNKSYKEPYEMAKTTPVPDVAKGTSPSKNIQRGNDIAWNSQRGYKDAAGAIADQHNKKPLPVGGKK
jgi:hypothetical protein